MKRFLMVLVLAITTLAVSAKAKQAVPVNDSVDEVEVYSDTTSVDSLAANQGFDMDDDENWETWSSSDTQSLMEQLGVDGEMIGGMVLVLAILFIIFILAPATLIGLILYFVSKSRKDKMKMMEMAIKNGKQIPVDALGTPCVNNEYVWNKGIKQMFLGAGLAILLWVPIGKLGVAIGLLIMLIGCGNMVIGYNAKQKQKEKEMRERMFGKSSEQETDKEF